ncbi:MAG TPA: T9SS type A sorting domain-containing protein [Bacteroidia bacterium]|nr:T9SS type A sorting domain-containing protein [Bacteroidia bacterium]
MKKLLLIALVLAAALTNAQITITNANMPVTGDTARRSTGTMASLLLPPNTPYTTTGANIAWSFDSLKANGQMMRKFESPISTPYPFFFSSSYGEKTADSLNLGIITFSNIYQFYKKSSASFNVDGTGMSYMAFPIPNFYSDKDELYMFPLNYGNHDSTTFKFSTISTSVIPAYSKQGYRITDVDGWGTITTPLSGVPVPCIRLTTTQYSQDSIKGNLAVGTFTIPLNVGFPNYQRSIQFLTLTEHTPYMEINGSVVGGTFLPTGVRYRDVPRYFAGVNEIDAQVALAIYPNPAAGELNIIIPKNKDLVLEIYSDLGQLVIKKNISNNEMMNKHTIDISSLSQGIYSGRLGDGKSVQNFKFIKQ